MWLRVHHPLSNWAYNSVISGRLLIHAMLFAKCTCVHIYVARRTANLGDRLLTGGVEVGHFGGRWCPPLPHEPHHANVGLGACFPNVLTASEQRGGRECRM